jgi:uncharacterized protein (DUF433 family)
MTAVTPLIEETLRGPSIAGTRITVYSVMEYLKGDWDRDFVKRVMVITDEQLDAVLEYIAQHKEEVERDYQRILRRSEELRAHYKKIQMERSPFPRVGEQPQMLFRPFQRLRRAVTRFPQPALSQQQIAVFDQIAECGRDVDFGHLNLHFDHDFGRFSALR